MIVFIINTPAQLYFYRDIMCKLSSKGHELEVFIRNYRETIAIANHIGIQYTPFSDKIKTKMGKIISLPFTSLDLRKHIVNLKPDAIVGGGLYGAISKPTKHIPYFDFIDAEPNTTILQYLQFRFMYHKVNYLFTPSSILPSFGNKHIKINSYKELSYLSPLYFTPNDSILSYLGLSKGQKYVILRLNAFDSVHDFGISGFTIAAIDLLIKRLENEFALFISSEAKLPDRLKPYTLKIPPYKIHDALYFASLLIGDTGTMTTEAACLGTPSILVHPLSTRIGNFIELQQKYDLIYCYRNDPIEAVNNAIRLLQMPSLKTDWAKKRDVLIRDKLDISRFIANYIDDRVISSRAQ